MAVSLTEQMDRVQTAVSSATQRLPDAWSVEVFGDHVIVRMDGTHYSVAYETDEDGNVILAEFDEWQKVESDWQPKSLERLQDAAEDDDTMLVVGGSIKAMGDGKIGGYLVKFTDAEHPDMVGDFFTAETDFDIEPGDRVTVYYNHGLDRILKMRKLGNGSMHVDDSGVWVEAQLAMRDKYEHAIYDMVKKNKLGWSSGTLPNLVETEVVKGAQWIKSWPLGKDATLTPVPAAGPELTRVTTLKSVVDIAEADDTFAALLPEADGKSAEQDEANTEADALLLRLKLMRLEV